MAYLVTYDLDTPGQNYDNLISAIKAYGTYAKLTESCWCISTANSAKDIRDNLEQMIDTNDKLFVAKLSGEAAWVGLSNKTSEWLQDNL